MSESKNPFKITSDQQSSHKSNLQDMADDFEEEHEENNDDTISESPVEEEENAEEVQLPKRSVLPYNVPEKIILVLDTALDENFTEFQLADNASCTSLTILIRGIEMFLCNKSAIDQRHQYAVMILNDNTVKWVVNFTSDIDKILKELNNLNECSTEDIFDLNQVFNLIHDHVMLEPVNEEMKVPPAYIVRTVLFYARSYTVPQLTRTQEVESLLSSPYFSFDILMVHEPPSTDNNCTKIANILQEIDCKGFSYFFSVTRSRSDLFVAMAKLLAHPLQRPVQSVAKYTLN